MDDKHANYSITMLRAACNEHTCQSSKFTIMFSACTSSGLSLSSSSGVLTSKIAATLLFCPSKISPSPTKRGHITAMAVPPSWPKIQMHKIRCDVLYPLYQHNLNFIALLTKNMYVENNYSHFMLSIRIAIGT